MTGFNKPLKIREEAAQQHDMTLSFVPELELPREV
jgi:hypothetical protein